MSRGGVHPVPPETSSHPHGARQLMLSKPRINNRGVSRVRIDVLPADGKPLRQASHLNHAITVRGQHRVACRAINVSIEQYTSPSTNCAKDGSTSKVVTGENGTTGPVQHSFFPFPTFSRVSPSVSASFSRGVFR